MGLLSSSKATSNTSTTTQDVTTVDNRVGGEAGSILGGNVSISAQGATGNVTVQSLDPAAIAAGRDLGLAALDLVRNAQETSTAANERQISQAYGLAQAARQSETSGAINNFARYGAVVVGLAVLAWAWSKRKG